MAQRRQLQSELATGLSTTGRHLEGINDDGPRLKKIKVDDDSSFPLLSLGSDLLTRCASYLDPNDMVQLGSTSTLFGRIQTGCQRSFVNEVSHQIFLGASEHEREALPKYADESDIKLYRELLSMRQGLVFGTDKLDKPDKIQISETGTRLSNGAWGTAIGSQVMRGGKHFVRFPITKQDRSSHGEIRAVIGIVRPLPWKIFAIANDYVPVHIRAIHDYDSDDEGDLEGELAKLLRNETMSSVRCDGSDVHCCAYSCACGAWFSTNWGDTYIARGGATYDAREGWPGMEEMRETGEIAMLLDYGAGTLTIYKNNRRLGIVQEGLAGEYSWMVSLGCDATIGIERGQL